MAYIQGELCKSDPIREMGNSLAYVYICWLEGKLVEGLHFNERIRYIT